MPTLVLYNTYTKKEDTFTPINPDHIKMYACGPTVYNYAHIGNARMAVAFDLLHRTLKHLYPKVTYVSNITDIDDKIIQASIDTNTPIKDITTKFEAIFNDDMRKLGVLAPTTQCRATEHIPEMITMITELITKGYAYQAEGHVLFHVPAYEKYGALSKRDRDAQIAGSRVEVAPYKKDPGDFVLWKPSTDTQPGWDSPWGFGRPGWHIECSAMSASTLGLPFDIHGGGLDLIFPHHENEIAQSCCAFGDPKNPQSFANYWIHNGFVTVKNEKMSKSIGNIQLVHHLLEDHHGEVLRMALLSTHYHQPLNWCTDTITQAKTALDKFYRCLHNLKDITPSHSNIPEPVLDALCDNLNTSKAFAELNSLVHQANRDDTDKAALKGSILATGNLLGLLQESPETWLGYTADSNIDTLIQNRNTARKNKDFAEADRIRDTLTEMGIEIEDTAQGTSWRKV